MKIHVAFAGLAALLLSACSSDDNTAAGKSSEPNPYEGYSSQVYADPAEWLCHPELSDSADVCRSANLATTIVQADGSSTVESFAPLAEPPVDCFYIYPTTSDDPTYNSDRNPDAQEIQTTQMQAARYGSVCRVFAPIYRQRTMIMLTLDSAVDPLITDEAVQQALETAYADVVDAFREYMAHYNKGRGFIILGHSQGARMGSRLLANEIEQYPYLMEHLIAAHIPGIPLEVPIGADVGGTLKKIPACRSGTQTACVIDYSSYRQGDPELSDPRFGVVTTPGMQAMCVNPAALTGGEAALQPYLPFILPPVFQLLLIPKGTGGPFEDPVTNVQTLLQMPFFSVPEQIKGECVVAENGASYLEIRIEANPDDPRADDYPAEFNGGTGWGMHLADVNLAQGDLVRLAKSQSEAWLAQ